MTPLNAVPSSETLLFELTQDLNREAARGVAADIQFVFNGVESGTYYLHLADGKCTLHKGEPAYPRLTIRVDADT